MNLRHPAAAPTEQPRPAPRCPSPRADAASRIGAERVSHLTPAQALGEAFPKPGRVSAWLYRCAKTHEGSSVPVCSPEHLPPRGPAPAPQPDLPATAGSQAMQKWSKSTNPLAT